MTETESKWSGRVRQWRASGRPAPEYAEGQGFKGSTLRWWASRLDRGGSTASPVLKKRPEPCVRMARVVAVPTPAAGSLTVRVGAAQFEVRAGFDRGLVRALVDALGGQS